MEIHIESSSRHKDKGDASVTIDGKTYKIEEGQISVAALKDIAAIPAGYELEEIKHGKLMPLPDSAHVHIKGGEQFVSHPRDGASS